MNEIITKVIEEHSIAWLIITFIIGLIGGVFGGGIKLLFEVFLPYSFKRRKIQQEIFDKYSSPLLQCADEVELRLSIILSYGIKYDWLSKKEVDKIKSLSNAGVDKVEPDSEYLQNIVEGKGYFFISTIYIFAKYFAWIKIIEKEGAFSQFPEKKEIRAFNKIIDKISSSFKVVEIFGIKYEDKDNINDSISLYSYLQSTIGEIMLNKENDKYTCISFQEFVLKYGKDKSFRQWLRNLEKYFEGLTNYNITELAEIIKEKKEYRLARLVLIQYWFFQLIKFLDPTFDKVKNRSPKHDYQIIKYLPEDYKDAIVNMPEDNISKAIAFLKKQIEEEKKTDNNT